jgi:carotenoid cleavage dioxygenase-like enzyme
MYIILCLSTFILNCSCFVFSNRVCRAYRQFYLKDKFVPVFDEKSIDVKHDNSLFSKINDKFFAQIGSNPRYTEDEDYHWFDGDGMIHGVLFKNNKLSYQNRWIQTKRLQLENKWKQKMFLYFGELRGFKGLLQILKFSLMQQLGFIPSSKGTANTALMNWHNRIFALHEGDMPYELSINYDKLNISTLERLNYPSIYSTTAHPVIDKKRNLLYLYGYNNYDFSYGNFIFNVFDKEMNLLNQKNISLVNNGMIHDVAFTGNEVIIPDLPLKYDVSRIMNEQLPLFFDKENGKTRFGILNVNLNTEPLWFDFDENFFIFHFSKAYKKSNNYTIFACVMDNLFMEDFVELDNLHNEKHVIRGEIRLKQISIDATTNKTEILTNPYIEDLGLDFYYNLDFPISSTINDKHVYCTIFDAALGYIKGYVKINTNNFANSKPEVFLFDKDVYGNSEPQTIIIDDVEYLLSFTNDETKSYISLINVEMKTIESIEIPTRIPPGFHSIYF